MSVPTTVDLLEVRARVNDDLVTGTISFYADSPAKHKVVFTDSGKVQVTTRSQRSHLVTVEVDWLEPSSVKGLLMFDLERKAKGRDIPKHLADGLRYHVLMTSKAIFDYFPSAGK